MLCILHLDLLDDPLSPAERAYLLGNDPEAIAEAGRHHAEQEELWSVSALVDGQHDVKLGQVNLDEARSWAIGADGSRRALEFARSRRPRPTPFAFVAELAEIRHHERDWLRLHTACDFPWNRTEECPDHGAGITAGRERQHRATLALREAVRKAVTATSTTEPGRSTPAY